MWVSTIKCQKHLYRLNRIRFIISQVLIIIVRVCVENSLLNAFVFVYLILSASHFLILFIHPFIQMAQVNAVWSSNISSSCSLLSQLLLSFFFVGICLPFFFCLFKPCIYVFRIGYFYDYSDLDGIHFPFEFGNISIDFTIDSHLNNRINHTDCIKRMDWFFSLFSSVQLSIICMCMCVACDAY